MAAGLLLAACQSAPPGGVVCAIGLPADMLARVKKFTPVDPLAVPSADEAVGRTWKVIDMGSPSDRMDAAAVYSWAVGVEACANRMQGPPEVATKLVLIGDAARLLRYGLLDMATFNSIRRDVDAAVKAGAEAAQSSQNAEVPPGRPPPRP